MNGVLTGKTAVVTGASRGIGQAMAVGLAEAGATVIGVSKSMSESGGETGELVRNCGAKFFGYSTDFSDRKAVISLSQKIMSSHSEVDILVNNAGTILRNEAAEHPDEWWDEVLEVNLSSQFILSKAFGREMLKRGHGKIIFTASLLSFQGGITVPGYAASKGGIAQLTKALANEWAGKGVNVNAIAPGYIATDNTAALREDPERSTSILSRIPANRWGSPEDFKGPVVFLSSDASNYVHGTVLPVDGGWLGR